MKYRFKVELFVEERDVKRIAQLLRGIADHIERNEYMQWVAAAQRAEGEAVNGIYGFDEVKTCKLHIHPPVILHACPQAPDRQVCALCDCDKEHCKVEACSFYKENSR